MTAQQTYNAEVAILGTLLNNNELLEEVICDLRPEDFLDFTHQAIYGAMVEMKHEGNPAIDMINLSTLKHKKIGDNENDAFRRLAEIANSPFAVSNLKSYCEIVKKASNRRKTAHLLQMTQQKIANGDNDYMEFMRKGLTAIENDQPYIVKPYSQILDETITKLEEDCASGNEITGISTGFHDLDFYTNGLQRGNMIVLAARPSMGKTMLMLNIADNIGLNQQLPVALFSLEQPERDLCKRTLVRACKIKGDNIFKAKMGGDDWEKISQNIERLNSTKVFINDKGGITIYEIRAWCRRVRNEHGLKAVFVDYIGMVQGGDSENETLRLGFISRELKVLAKDFDIPVFVLCQLNRKIEGRGERKYMLSDIRQSGNIEQDADVVMFLDSQENEASLFIEKNRNGRTGEVKLTLAKEYFEFKNYAKF